MPLKSLTTPVDLDGLAALSSGHALSAPRRFYRVNISIAPAVSEARRAVSNFHSIRPHEAVAWGPERALLEQGDLRMVAVAVREPDCGGRSWNQETETVAEERTRALSEVLDQLESAAHGESIAVEEVIEKLGRKSFASLMLLFSLVSTSPASAIPGLTATVAVIVFLLVVQMMIGRDCVWLPSFITRRRMSTTKLCKGIDWLRKPVRFIEKIFRARFIFLLQRPWIWLPLSLILVLTLFMPFMEVIPTSGSIASAVIALFAASLLTRDGVLVVLSLILLLAVPVAVWHFGFSG